MDILLEDWVAPLVEGSTDVDRVVTVKRRSNRSRFEAARELRAAEYDVAFNLHGGSTAALLMRASGATHRVGYRDYAYASLHNHLAPPSAELWGTEKTHSAEQQLALLGWAGVPVTDRPATRLFVNERASEVVSAKLRAAGLEEGEPFALMHPAAAFDSKTWAAENFARVADHLAARGLRVVAVASPEESGVIEEVRRLARGERCVGFTDLRLPEVAALAARAALFVGNDSGVAHVAAAFAVPTVVVFGSSNVAHWRPWTTVALGGRPRRDALRPVPRLHLRRVRRSPVHPPRHRRAGLRSRRAGDGGGGPRLRAGARLNARPPRHRRPWRTRA